MVLNNRTILSLCTGADGGLGAGAGGAEGPQESVMAAGSDI